MSDPWVVDIKGRAGERSFEISVLRDSNAHGKSSYGWFGRYKLLITHNGGPCAWPLTQLIWDRQVALAHEIAATLNAQEATDTPAPPPPTSPDTPAAPADRAPGRG